jgi:sigma-B regulation protein RsbU (phosphoserine phosphatase)
LLNALIHPQDLARFMQVIGSSIAAKTGFNIEFRIRRPDGTIRWVWAQANMAETGSARNAVCVVEDITDRKIAEIQLFDALENEKELAGTIQRSLLMNEEDVQVPGIESTLVSIPSTKIDGDFLDMYSFGLVLDVVVGDVMGKGIHAALIGAGAKTRFLRAHAKLGASCSDGGLPSPAQIVEEVDKGMANRLMNLDTFFTVQYLRFAREESYFEYVDCGHTPIIIWDGEACWAYKGTNPPIGFVENQKFSACRIPLRPGNLVLVYSDGATEAGTQESGQFGEERLFAAIRANVHLDTDGLVKQLLREIEDFSDGKRPFDDLTLAAFRVRNEPSPPPCRFRFDREYAADLNVLEEIREQVRGMLEPFSSSQMDEDARYMTVLTASEAATNVIVHGLGKDSATTFTLRMESFSNWFYLAFRYRGNDFDWAKVRTPSVLSMDEQGYGLHIVRNAMGSIVYTRSDNGLLETILSGELRG